jgi:katanin p60 ATPase-containing subunit A1
MSSEAVELQSSIKQARQFVVESNYKSAVVFYNNLDREVEHFVAGLADASLRQSWEEVRMALTAERQLVEEVQKEIDALVNPAEGARRDRHGQGHPASPTEADAPPMNAYQARESRPIARVPVPVIRPRTPPSGAHLDDVNEKLYGDRDKFGPGFVPPSGPKPFPKPKAVAKTPPTEPMNPARKKEKVKPPLPAAARKAPADAQKADEGKFSPKNPGDKDLVAMVESDIYRGKTDVTMDDIAGLWDAKEALNETVVYPLLLINFFKGIRRPWRGVLMYGPPGTGKTMLAKAVASGTTTFFNISTATLTSKSFGESEKLVRVLFEMAAHYAPSTIFIDEIDSLFGSRGSGNEHEASLRIKNMFLTHMDGMGTDKDKRICVLGATNNPWSIDNALLRRLEKRIYIPLPDLDNRIQVIHKCVCDINLAEDVDFQRIALAMEGFSGHDVANVCRSAALMPARRFLRGKSPEDVKENAEEYDELLVNTPVTNADFQDGIRRTPPSVSKSAVSKFEEWQKKYERELA